MKLDYDRPWLTRLFSLLLAVLLFFYVSYENQNRFQTNNNNLGASVVSSEVLTNLPIEVNIDSEKYFVSGLPDYATLRLEGPQAVLFQTSITQNFTIQTPDLNELGVGTHKINLVAVGLSDELSYTVSPPEITITIEEKDMREFPVEVEISPDIDLADGVSIVEDEIELDQQSVMVSGAVSTLDKIDRVVAYVNPTQTQITNNLTVASGLVVLDQEGNPLNVNVDTNQVNIYLPVEETEKSVPIVLEVAGGNSDHYQLTLSENEPKTLRVKGEPEAIQNIANWVIEVNVSGIEQSQVADIPVGDLPEGIDSVDRDKVRVNIEVKD